MRRLFLFLLCFLFAENCFSGEKFYSITAWNVQTFFDSVTEGTEYPEFKNSKNWNTEKYETRLKRLCDVMSAINSDIFVFEEIENQNILRDIGNQFAGKAWNPKTNWNYCCFAKDEKSSIGCAVFSRFPVLDVKTHSIDIRIKNMKQPSVRPLMEVTLEINGSRITILVNHWKSKSGGKEQTEIWRDWQENVLAQKIASLESDFCKDEIKGCIICGDFNRDSEDFIKSTENSENIILRNPFVNVSVFSCWDAFFSSKEERIKNGSYYFKQKWERIDHIFSAGKIKITKFAVNTEEKLSHNKKIKLVTENGIPKSYHIFSGEGFSDHLPVTAEFLF